MIIGLYLDDELSAIGHTAGEVLIIDTELTGMWADRIRFIDLPVLAAQGLTFAELRSSA